MKTIKVIPIILLFFVGFYYPTQGQVVTKEENQTPQELYDFHIKKMKSNRTVGWITLGAGVAMMAGGTAIAFNNLLGESPPGTEALVNVGFVSSLCSIVPFAIGKEHKKRAKIQLQHGAVAFNNPHKYTGISISYSF